MVAGRWPHSRGLRLLSRTLTGARAPNSKDALAATLRLVVKTIRPRGLARPRVLLAALGFWTIPAVLVTTSGLSQGRGESLGLTFLAEGLSWYFWAFATPPIFALVRSFPFDGGRWRRSIPAHALSALLFSMAYALTAAALFLLTLGCQLLAGKRGSATVLQLGSVDRTSTRR